MEEEKLRRQIGVNISNYRKSAGMTQAGLAEKLNYSDKAVSKWERGESIPDVITLTAIARLLRVSVEDLLADPNALPENPGKVERVMGKVVEKALKRKANKRIILNLSSILVWFVALAIYVVVSSIGIEKSWLAFFFALPADAIVRLSLCSAWRDFRYNRLYISTIMWGGLLSLYVTLLVLMGVSVWRIFLLGVPGQAAILFWFRLFPRSKEEENGQN